MKKRIAVIGAAGYTGRYLIERLSRMDAEIWAIVRHANLFLIPDAQHVQVKHIHELTATHKADVVINLAYSKAPLASHFRKENEAIIHTIALLSHEHTQLIHVSTLAVFGFQLEKEQTLALPPHESDYPYVQSKAEMEHALARRFPTQRIDMVRPGNIWGPACPSWTTPLLDALVYNLPVLSSEPSCSNITDVHNLADYIAFLCEHEATSFYHHVAELGAISWEQFITPLSDWFGCSPVYLPSSPTYYTHPVKELLSMLSYNPAQFLLTATRSRHWQQPARQVVNLIPKSLKQLRHTEEKPSLYSTGQVFHWIMGSKTLFVPCTDSRWIPPVSFNDSLALIKNYAVESGYVVNR